AERDRDLRPRADALVELLALGRRKLLGIVEAARDALGVEDDGRGDHWSGQWTAPRFVAARNRPHAALERRALAAERGANALVPERQAGGGGCDAATHTAMGTRREPGGKARGS